MNDALYIAATGMQAHQRSVEAIANNLANVNTAGYKKTRVAFADLVYRNLNGAGPATTDGSVPAQLLQGSGVSVAAIIKEFSGGDLKNTGHAFDFAVQGEGFIELANEDGGAAFIRSGTFGVDKDGFLTAAGGLQVKPAMHVGSDLSELVIGTDGRVQVRARAQDPLSEVGRLDLVRFPDVSGLAASSNGAYRATEHSGEPIAAQAGEDGMGLVYQGQLEGSNVNLTEEMVQLMTAQRAYESSVKLIQATDEMMSMSNNLRK
jgi:flagellar basal-body rod protein FlgG